MAGTEEGKAKGTTKTATEMKPFVMFHLLVLSY